jgi:hypothetical protein
MMDNFEIDFDYCSVKGCDYVGVVVDFVITSEGTSRTRKLCPNCIMKMFKVAKEGVRDEIKCLKEIQDNINKVGKGE